MANVVVVTGGGAGVGRATAIEFARQGYDVAVIGRDAARLERTATDIRAFGQRAVAVPADVADSDAIEAAADTIERALGPIDVWVNNAMATIFGSVREITAAEFRRATEVTYLGTVHGTQSALRRMRRRRRGTIVNVGSALAYRSVPLQAPYCAAKSAIRGFTDSLRSEIIHDGDGVHLTMVHLPAVNTPQFEWARNRTGRKPQPVPPIFEPEVPARAIVYAATANRREIWVGLPTVQAILANRIAPGLVDRYLATKGYSGQLTGERASGDGEGGNLFAPVPGFYAARGRFSDRARDRSAEMFTDRHKRAAVAVGFCSAAMGVAVLLRRGRAA